MINDLNKKTNNDDDTMQNTNIWWEKFFLWSKIVQDDSF